MVGLSLSGNNLFVLVFANVTAKRQGSAEEVWVGMESSVTVLGCVDETEHGVCASATPC